ncbi:MAG: geranylgeranylglyceryl/heptaprenylglyceryl phosphate synthase [Candidatus Eisenbacteria bacterium]
MGPLFELLQRKRRETGALFLPLVDQERIEPAACAARATLLEENGADALLVGSSFALRDRLDIIVSTLKEGTSLPVVLFPGSAHQISRHADGILFLTLLSGRNPLFLVEEQVRSAPRVKEHGLEAIPTGYLLVGSGGRTVHFVSGTQPIPADRPEIVMAHALAAEYMGMRAVYLEGGSGAASPVPAGTIRAVRGYVTVPLFVGGGIRTAAEAAAAREAGADFVVVGHALEGEVSGETVRAFADAIHGARALSARRK